MKQPADLYTRPKVDEKCDGAVGRHNTVEGLCGVSSVELADRLQLDDDRVLDNEICHVLTHNYSVVVNGKPVLLQSGQPRLSEFVGERILIDFLKESRTKSVVNGVGTPNNALRKGVDANKL